MSDGSTTDERYFNWLYSLIEDEKNRNPAESHWLLCERLYKKPFLWFIQKDENRAADGIDLRYEYLDHHKERASKDWMELDCSVFEMLIALSRRASFQSGWAPDWWFWHLLNNLELGKYADDVYHSAIDDAVDRALDRLLERDYDYSGLGGLFPLRDPERDQTEVEIWYQLSAYLIENIDF